MTPYGYVHSSVELVIGTIYTLGCFELPDWLGHSNGAQWTTDGVCIDSSWDTSGDLYSRFLYAWRN